MSADMGDDQSDVKLRLPTNPDTLANHQYLSFAFHNSGVPNIHSSDAQQMQTDEYLSPQ